MDDLQQTAHTCCHLVQRMPFERASSAPDDSRCVQLLHVSVWAMVSAGELGRWVVVQQCRHNTGSICQANPLSCSCTLLLQEPLVHVIWGGPVTCDHSVTFVIHNSLPCCCDLVYVLVCEPVYAGTG
jgi:hypothetical protein